MAKNKNKQKTEKNSGSIDSKNANHKSHQTTNLTDSDKSATTQGNKNCNCK